MNKSEMIKHMAEKAGINIAEAGTAFEAFCSGIIDTLKSGDKVTLTGFGSFSVSDRDARQGRNPQTGETIQIAARKVVKFSASKDLKDEVN